MLCQKLYRAIRYGFIFKIFRPCNSFNDHVQRSAIRLGFSFIHLAANFVASRPVIPHAGVCISSENDACSIADG